jgi:hypothetical protein
MDHETEQLLDLGLESQRFGLGGIGHAWLPTKNLLVRIWEINRTGLWDFKGEAGAGG